MRSWKRWEINREVWDNVDEDHEEEEEVEEEEEEEAEEEVVNQ